MTTLSSAGGTLEPRTQRLVSSMTSIAGRALSSHHSYRTRDHALTNSYAGPSSVESHRTSGTTYQPREGAGMLA